MGRLSWSFWGSFTAAVMPGNPCRLGTRDSAELLGRRGLLLAGTGCCRGERPRVASLTDRSIPAESLVRSPHSGLVDPNREAVERRRDSARELGLEVGVEVVVREMREVRAVGTDLTRC